MLTNLIVLDDFNQPGWTAEGLLILQSFSTLIHSCHFTDLFPLMKRVSYSASKYITWIEWASLPQLENYQKPVNNDTHGYEGPIAISNGGTTTALAHDFLRASDSLGIPFSGMSLPSSRGLIPDSFSLQMISKISRLLMHLNFGPNTLTVTPGVVPTPQRPTSIV